MEFKGIKIEKKILLYFLLLFFAIQLGEAKNSNHPPPVEKVKPIEKKKEINRQKRLKKKQLKKTLRSLRKNKKNNGTLSLSAIIFFGLIGLILFAIVGGIILGISIGISPLWLIGVCLLGGSNLIGFILFLVYFLVGDKGYKEGEPKGWFEKNSHSLIFAFLALIIVFFLIGSIFLIWGLIITLSFFWVLGLIQIGVVLLIAILFFIFMYTIQGL